MKTKIKQLFRQQEQYADQTVTIMGWVRTNRAQAQFGFLNVNDGSFFENLQVVYDNNLENFEEISKFRVGVSAKIVGKVVLTPEMKQPLEKLSKKQFQAKLPEKFWKLIKETTWEHGIQEALEVLH